MRPSVSDESDDTRADLVAGDAALQWARKEGAAERIAERSWHRARQRRRRRLLMVAGTAGLFMMVLGQFWWASDAPATVPVSASVVAPPTQVLPDGTVVELRDTARLVTDFSPAFRRVVLEAGEAYFQVVSNRERPFVVRANGVDVRAVGTAFSVQLQADAVGVLVTEGRVEVEPGRPAAGPAPPVAPESPTQVDAGNWVAWPTAGAAAEMAASPQPRAISAAEMSQLLAWRVPRIEFSGTPLVEALLLFNRYSPVTIVLGDTDLGKLQLSGVVRPDSPAALLRVLENDFGIEAEQQGEDRIILRRQPGASESPAEVPGKFL